MWYEILPCAGIIFAALTIPSYAGYWVNRALLGNHYKRDQSQNYDYSYFLRDMAITGNPYKQQGLEAIPDEETK